MNSLSVVDKQFAMALNRPIPGYLTPDEIHQLLENCHKRRNHLLVNIAWQTGARISEILQLKRGSVDLTNRQIRFITLKQRKTTKKQKPTQSERIIPIQPELTAEIATYIAENRIDDMLFDISRIYAFNIVRKLAIDTGINKRISPHTFRHSFAVNCLMQGVPLTVVSNLLGHSHITTTLIYLKIVQPDIRNLMYAVKF